jgi:type III restriction enzyme
MSRHDYFIQGWRKHKIFPDFIAAEPPDYEDDDYGKVWVLETKGEHLQNDDTAYKKHIFDICNEIRVNRSGGKLFENLGETEFGFELVFGDQWRSHLNDVFVG